MPSLSVNLAALAAGAEAAGTAVPIIETGGVKEIKGVWDKGDEVAMKASLPGSVVLFKGEVPRFGFIPLANSVQSKPSGLEVKISMTGDTTGQWYKEVASTASDNRLLGSIKSIWIGVVPGNKAGKPPWQIGSLPVELWPVTGSDDRFEELMVGQGDSKEARAIADAASGVGHAVKDWPAFMGVAAVPPTIRGPEGHDDVVDGMAQVGTVNGVATLPLVSFLRALRVVDAEANATLGDLGRFVHSLLRTASSGDAGSSDASSGPRYEAIAACLGGAMAKAADPVAFVTAVGSNSSIKAAAEAGEAMWDALARLVAEASMSSLSKVQADCSQLGGLCGHAQAAEILAAALKSAPVQQVIDLGGGDSSPLPVDDVYTRGLAHAAATDADRTEPRAVGCTLRGTPALVGESPDAKRIREAEESLQAQKAARTARKDSASRTLFISPAAQGVPPALGQLPIPPIPGQGSGLLPNLAVGLAGAAALL